MRTEERIGRPFAIPRPIAMACHGTRLLLGPHEVEVGGENPSGVTAERAAAAANRLEIVIPWSASIGEDLKRVGCDLRSTELVVLEVLPTTRTVSIAWKESASNLPDGDITVDLIEAGSQKFLDAVAFGGAATLTAYLISKTRGGDCPYPVGMWLSRGKFRFGGMSSGLQIGVHPLDDAQYEVDGVSRKAASYLSIKGSIAKLQADKLDVSIYVNKELLSRVNAGESPASTAITRRLEVEVVTNMLARLADECRADGINSWFDLAQFDNSVGVHLISNLATEMGWKQEPERVFEMLMGGGLAILRSFLEAELGVLEAEVKAVSPSTIKGGS